MHSVLNPNSEYELYKYFQLDKWIFLDVWANVWKYSVYLWKQSSEIIIHSFEPNTHLFKNYLSENIKLNSLNNVILNNYWLSDVKWTFDLYVPENNFWSWSIENTYDWWTKYVIKLIKLDDYIGESNIDISEIRLIKIDVEWHEFKLIKWASKTFKKLSDCRIIIEIFSDSPKFQNTIKLINEFWFELTDKLYWDNYIFYKK